MKPKNNPKQTKRLPAYLDEKTFVTLMENMISVHHKVACLLAFESGLRISEVMNLQKEDFRLETNEILIRQGKGNKDRWVTIPRDWLPEFLDYIPINCSNRALQTAFYSARDRAGLKKELHFHSLRHSYATHLRDKIPLQDISESMGHQDLATTMIYAHMNATKRNNNIKRVF